MQNKENEKWLIARPLGLHYNLHVSPSVHDQFNENVHDFCTTWYILIEFCTQMHVDSIQHWLHDPWVRTIITIQESALDHSTTT